MSIDFVDIVHILHPAQARFLNAACKQSIINYYYCYCHSYCYCYCYYYY